VLAARSVRLEPTQISADAARSGLTPPQLALVANALFGERESSLQRTQGATRRGRRSPVCST